MQTNICSVCTPMPRMVHTQKWMWKLRLTASEAKLRSLLKYSGTHLVFGYLFKYVKEKKWGDDHSPLPALHSSEFPNCVRYERVQSVTIGSVVSSLWAICTPQHAPERGWRAWLYRRLSGGGTAISQPPATGRPEVELAGDNWMNCFHLVVNDSALLS